MCTDARRKRITCTITRIITRATIFNTVDNQQMVYGNIANQIHGFTIDYDKFILMIFTYRTNHPPVALQTSNALA